MAVFHHHRAVEIPVPHEASGLFLADAPALPVLVVGCGVFYRIGGLGHPGVNNRKRLQPQVVFGVELRNTLGIPQQDGFGNAFLVANLGGLEYAVRVCLVERQALGGAAGFLHDQPNKLVVAAQAVAQLLFVGQPVGDGFLSHPALHGRTGNGRRHRVDQAGIEGLGNQIGGAKCKVALAVGQVDHFGDGFLSETGDGVYRRQLHGFVDFGGPHVQCSPEDKGEAQHVVHLIGIVGPAGRHDDVLAGRHGCSVINLGIGIGQGENDGILAHAPDHVWAEDVSFGETHKDVGVLEGFLQGAQLGGAGKTLLFFGQIVAVGVNDAFGIADGQVLGFDAQGQIEGGAADGAGSGTVEDHLDSADFFLDDFQAVQQGGPGNDGGAVLVVVHDGNVQLFAQPLFDVEAVGRRDVFQVDASEGGGQDLDGLNELVGVFGVQLQVEGVDVGKDFEKDALAFHDGLGGQRANVSQSQNRRSVGDHGH